MNNEIKSKSIHNNLKNSANRFSKKIKPLEILTKKFNNYTLNSIEIKLLSKKND